MGYKIPDLKQDLKDAIYNYFNTHGHKLVSDGAVLTDSLCDDLAEDLCDEVDEKFEKIQN
tara:strand:- start:202 stop:381 length:180 start_codon:yes stop_codon:yes gene_type:complete